MVEASNRERPFTRDEAAHVVAVAQARFPEWEPGLAGGNSRLARIIMPAVHCWSAAIVDTRGSGRQHVCQPEIFSRFVVGGTKGVESVRHVNAPFARC